MVDMIVMKNIYMHLCKGSLLFFKLIFNLPLIKGEFFITKSNFYNVLCHHKKKGRLLVYRAINVDFDDNKPHFWLNKNLCIVLL